MNLRVEEFERRDVPAALYGPTTPGPVPFPEFDGPKYVVYGDVDGDGRNERLTVAGAGGGPVLEILSGGRGEYDATKPTEGMFEPLFVGPVMADTDARVGLDIATLDNGLFRPCTVVVTWLAGGGPVVKTWDFSTGRTREFLAADPDYRGGVELIPTTVVLDPEDRLRVPYYDRDLVVMPREGGGPVLSAYSRDGELLTRFLFGPADDRRAYTVHPASVGYQIGNGEWGLTIDTPDGESVVYSWAGTRYE